MRGGRVILIAFGVVAAAGFTTMLAALGLPPVFVVSWILVILAVGIGTRLSAGDDARSWPPERPSRTQGSEVSRLAWAINSSTGIVGPALVRRLRAIASHRLEILGLDLETVTDHPRIDVLLGGGIRDVLDAPAMRHDDLDRVLDAIENLPTTLERR